MKISEYYIVEQNVHPVTKHYPAGVWVKLGEIHNQTGDFASEAEAREYLDSLDFSGKFRIVKVTQTTVEEYDKT